MVAVAPAGEVQVETGADSDPGLDAARRYARLVATDIRLYNEEAVTLGRRNGDLVKRLEEHLGRGKETFLRRHGDLGPTAIELLRDAYVQVLAGGDADHYAVTNLTLMTKNLLRGLEVSASVRNLFDEEYSDPGSGEQVQDQIEQDGRTFWLKVKYGF